MKKLIYMALIITGAIAISVLLDYIANMIDSNALYFRCMRVAVGAFIGAGAGVLMLNIMSPDILSDRFRSAYIWLKAGFGYIAAIAVALLIEPWVNSSYNLITAFLLTLPAAFWFIFVFIGKRHDCDE